MVESTYHHFSKMMRLIGTPEVVQQGAHVLDHALGAAQVVQRVVRHVERMQLDRVDPAGEAVPAAGRAG